MTATATATLTSEERERIAGGIVITLPWPHKDLSPNARIHWRKRSAVVKSARWVGRILAQEAGARRIGAESLSVIITFHQPDRRLAMESLSVGVVRYG